VIASFKHRGLKKLYEDDDHRGLSAAHVDKIKRILARLDEAAEISNMALPGFGLHPLKGKLKGFLGRIGLRKLAHRLSFSERHRLRCGSHRLPLGGHNHAHEESASSRFVCPLGLS
jgi:hypothetical protein